MATGISLPVTTNQGRMVLVSGDEYIEQLVKTALLGSESDNPFQDIGLGEFMLFGINDGMQEAEIRERVVRIFVLLKRDQLARIDEPNTDIVFTRDAGDLYMQLAYINMETQERREIDLTVPHA
jgi:hypothetical protein